MEITLHWENPNQGSEGVRVYRSTTPIDINSLPPPIATVGPDETSYVDRDVVRHQRYYYRFGVFRGDDLTVSGEKEVWALPYTGPGPQSLQAGDWEVGYFGQVPASELFLGSVLAGAVDLSQGTAINEGTAWLKFIDRGKILYIPQRPLRHTVNWNSLYNIGCVYGTDDNGADPGATPTNQLTIVEKNGDQFIVRLMTGLGEGVTEGLTDSNDFPDFTGASEWDRLFARCLFHVAETQAGENFDSLGYEDTNTVGSAATGVQIVCQERSLSDPNQRIVRGMGSVTAYHSRIGHYSTSINSTLIGWRPVLELLL